MKKVIVMAIALMASTMTFAAKSEAIKAITKSKDYAEAVQLVKQHLNELADNAEKAEAYNHLVELAMIKVSKENGVAIENAAKAQLGGKIEPYDTVGLCDALCLAIENAIECNKYDQLPDAKGRVKPKFYEKNSNRLWGPRNQLITLGDEYRQKNDFANAIKYWEPYLDSYCSPLFEKIDHTPEKAAAEQIAYLATYMSYQLKDVEKVNKFAEIAKTNEQYKDDAFKIQLSALQINLKTKEDSLNCINKFKELYEQDSNNASVIEALYNLYTSSGQKDVALKFIDEALAKNPNNFIALALKGGEIMNSKPAEAVIYLKKASEVQPENPSIALYVGTAISLNAQSVEDDAKGVGPFVLAYNEYRLLK